jgi:hypothetical protein
VKGVKSMKEFFLTGNNDGDYIQIKQYKNQEKDNTCFLEVGHCCVVILQHQVPVEFVTNVIYKELFEKANGDVKKMVENSLRGFKKDFVNERVEKVHKY